MRMLLVCRGLWNDEMDDGSYRLVEEMEDWSYVGSFIGLKLCVSDRSDGLFGTGQVLMSTKINQSCCLLIESGIQLSAFENEASSMEM